MTRTSLYKTTVVIWTDYDPINVELADLAWQATEGDAYCSKLVREHVAEPWTDSDWDGTEFFEDGDLMT